MNSSLNNYGLSIKNNFIGYIKKETRIILNSLVYLILK